MAQAIGGLIGTLFGLLAVASWLTHVVFCIKTASWGFLIAMCFRPDAGEKLTVGTRTHDPRIKNVARETS